MQAVKRMTLIAIAMCAQLGLSGCASTLLISALKEEKTTANQAPAVNHQMLHAIQSLRALQSNQPSEQSSDQAARKSELITFDYGLRDAELNVVDRLKLMQLLNGKQQLTVSIAPAKANSLWQQLSLTHKRVAALQAIAAQRNTKLVIAFQPSLADDTLQIKVEV
ncbi:hypothetical protein DXX92_15130 [Thalassotalea euphylliae]|uniref:Uncharacterized protein n=2 Tax=Thalassotalea euphylliae TaxID=1655234 RepID=A0A3E0UIU1_9GAMM|nr:hypothetical protein DXX92_15130 [Thalassotalea euphylliae]